jgi:arginase
MIDRAIANIPAVKVRADPVGAAQEAGQWARRFKHLLVHLDADVLDYLDLPLAENTRRNEGLRFDQLMSALPVLISSPNWAALTVCEVNPDHGEADGSTLRVFADGLADAISSAARLHAAAGASE